jgi:predicted nucleotidyltransferase
VNAQPRGVLPALVRENVEFILIGGMAAIVHGSSRFTQDIDVVYRRTQTNIDRIVSALSEFEPYPRGAPPGLPFRFDSRTINGGLNFTFISEVGDFDLLGEVAGGDYITLLPGSEVVNAFGMTFRCVSLSQLIELKQAAGRPKDYEHLAELRKLQSEADNP